MSRPQIDWCTVEVTSRCHIIEGASFGQKVDVIKPIAEARAKRGHVKILKAFKADAPLTREEKAKLAKKEEVEAPKPATAAKLLTREEPATSESKDGEAK